MKNDEKQEKQLSTIIDAKTASTNSNRLSLSNRLHTTAGVAPELRK